MDAARRISGRKRPDRVQSHGDPVSAETGSPFEAWIKLE
jgi:hypothetical protein